MISPNDDIFTTDEMCHIISAIMRGYDGSVLATDGEAIIGKLREYRISAGLLELVLQDEVDVSLNAESGDLTFRTNTAPVDDLGRHNGR
jgi:hypothetical protein